LTPGQLIEDFQEIFGTNICTVGIGHFLLPVEIRSKDHPEKLLPGAALEFRLMLAKKAFQGIAKP
jgi:hypothetical protein